MEGSDGEHSYRDEVSDRVRPHVPAGRNVTPRPFNKEFGKIEYIKALRKYVTEQIKAFKDPDNDTVNDIEDISRLRNTKEFADRIFNGEK